MAARAGVSTATVSRTLASPDLVSDEARARVLTAIKATGYTPNIAARNLRARRTMMVLVVVPNIGNHFFAEVLRGIDDELVGSGYGMIIANLDNQPEREARYVDLAFAGQVDGVLLLGGRVPAGNGRQMSDAGVPMATICVAIRGSGLPFVMVDDIEASTRVVAHLHALGHRRFGYIAGPVGNMNEIGRRRGFVAALAELGLDPEDAIYWPGDFMLQAGVDAAQRLPSAQGQAQRDLCRQRSHGDQLHENGHRRRHPRAAGCLGGRIRRHRVLGIRDADADHDPPAAPRAWRQRAQECCLRRSPARSGAAACISTRRCWCAAARGPAPGR